MLCGNVEVESNTLRCGHLVGAIDEARDKCLGTIINALNIGLPPTGTISICVDLVQSYVEGLDHN